MLTANPFRRKGAAAVSPADFVPGSMRPPKPATGWRDQKARMLSWAKSLGADVVVVRREGASDG